MPCVYLGRQKAGEVPDWKNAFHTTHPFFILKEEQYVFHFVNVQSSSAWGKIRPQAPSFNQGPFSPSVYLGRHWCQSRDKMFPAFPLCFGILSTNQKLDGGETSEQGYYHPTIHCSRHLEGSYVCTQLMKPDTLNMYWSLGDCWYQWFADCSHIRLPAL